MLSASKIGSSDGAVRYFTGFTKYYTGDRSRFETPAYDQGLDPAERPVHSIDLPGEPAGYWHGPAAEALGLSGVVLPTHLKRLFRGVHPRTQQPLVQNARMKPGRKKKDARSRVPGWDFTLSAPKAVSVLWALGSPELRDAIQTIHDEAVRDTLDLASSFVFARQGQGGSTIATADPVFAVFQHSTSREEEPQLHSHCLLINSAKCRDGKFRAIHSPLLFDQFMLLGAYYRDQLAFRLRTRLGIETERAGTSFTVTGVPDEILDHFSTRRKQIVAALNRAGEGGFRPSRKAAIETRKEKSEELSHRPQRELFQKWQTQGRRFGVTAPSLDALRDQPGVAEALPPNPTDIVNQAIKNLLTGRAHFSRKKFLLEALYIATEYNIDPEELLRHAAYQLENRPDIRLLITDKGWECFTTQAQLDEEEHLHRLARKLMVSPGIAASKKAVATLLNQRTSIRPDQRQAFLHLAQAQGRLRILNGPAGTGKTYVLGSVVEALRESSSQTRVIGLAPTKVAAKKLAEAGISETHTLTRFLGDFGDELSLADHVRHTTEQLARAAQGKKTWRLTRPRPLKIDQDTVVIVDEASMMGMKHATLLFQHVHRSGATLLLVGDPYQLPPVSDQPVYHSLSQRIGAEQLTVVTRQKEDWARDVVRHLMNADVERALDEYDRQGKVHATNDPISSLVWDWWHMVAARSPRDGFVIATTNEDVETLNDRCQQTMLRNGRLTGSPVSISDQTDDGQCYNSEVFAGDRILFTRNSSESKDGFLVQNGTRATVVATEPLLGSIAVQIDGSDGAVIRLKPADFPHIRRGYAGTTYKAQGETIPKTFILVTDQMQDLPTTYVQLSRHKQDCHLYLASELWEKDKEGTRPIVRHMARRPDLRLASDIVRKMDRAKSAGLLGFVFSPSEPLYVASRSPHFTWEPACVVEQGQDLSLKVITDHTRQVFEIPTKNLRTQVRRDLDPELSQALAAQTGRYGRLQEFASHPLEPGDAILYSWPVKGGTQSVDATVRERHEDGSVTILIGGRPSHVPEAEVVDRIERRPSEPSGKEFLRKSFEAAYVPRYDTRGESENDNGAPNAPGGQTTPQTGGAVPPSAASLAPSSETDPANILKANARITAASRNAKPEPVATSPTQPDEPKSNILKANAKILAESRNAQPKPDATASNADDVAGQAQAWTDKTRREAQDGAGAPNVLKANAPLARESVPPMSIPVPETPAAPSKSNILPANFEPATRASVEIARGALDQASQLAATIGKAAQPVAALGASAWNAYQARRKRKQEQLQAYIASFSVGDTVCFAYRYQPETGHDPYLRRCRARVIQVTPTQIHVRLVGYFYRGEVEVIFDGKQCLSLHRKPPKKDEATWYPDEKSKPRVKSWRILKAVHAFEGADDAAYEVHKQREDAHRAWKRQEEERLQAEFRQRQLQAKYAHLSQPGVSHPGTQWSEGDYVSIRGYGCYQIRSVMDHGLIVSCERVGTVEFIEWDEVENRGIRRVSRPQRPAEEPTPTPAAQPQPAPAAAQPAPSRRDLFEPHEIAACFQMKSTDVLPSTNSLHQPTSPSYSSTPAPTAQPDQYAAMAQTHTQRQTNAFHQQQQQQQAPTHSSSRTVETRTQYGPPGKQPT